jgi:hypothetical protein
VRRCRVAAADLAGIEARQRTELERQARLFRGDRLRRPDGRPSWSTTGSPPGPPPGPRAR